MADVRALAWEDGDIVILDQTLLPERESTLRLTDTHAVAEAIVALRIRGAPALGIIGAMGVAQAHVRGADVRTAAETLRATRPTAVNLGWGIDRALAAADPVAEALAIQAEDAAACEAIAANARPLFGERARVLTHCNTGALVTGGIGTALGAIRRAYEAGAVAEVIATETRPLLQGARLTAWELRRYGIPHAVCVDGAAAGLIARGQVDLVIVGADRIAANRDVANKVGTYPLALAARAADIPFVVAAPTSTIDEHTPSGDAIPVEERAPEEVIAGDAARNPAFDITPAALISAIVTERGVERPTS